jgi:hypothetical protein
MRPACAVLLVIFGICNGQGYRAGSLIWKSREEGGDRTVDFLFAATVSIPFMLLVIFCFSISQRYTIFHTYSGLQLCTASPFFPKPKTISSSNLKHTVCAAAATFIRWLCGIWTRSQAFGRRHRRIKRVRACLNLYRNHFSTIG